MIVSGSSFSVASLVAPQTSLGFNPNEYLGDGISEEITEAFRYRRICVWLRGPRLSKYEARERMFAKWGASWARGLCSKAASGGAVKRCASWRN
jgi:hypothetical protein